MRESALEGTVSVLPDHSSVFARLGSCMPRSTSNLLILALALAGLLGGTGVDAQTPKRIYIANDDHTDYMWTADEATYRQAFLEMIDYYLGQADRTAGNAAPYRGRFNLDGTFWVWEYERNKSTADVTRLMNRVADGSIGVPLNPLVTVYGGMPAEAVVRALYYGGQLERRFNLRIPIAVAMENQTHPHGLAALWAGSGAKYSWKGVCGCATWVSTSSLANREHEIYWMTAPDGSRVLMKWHSLVNNDFSGGYAEARNPLAIVDFLDTDPTFTSRYPYRVAGGFGKGWDDLKTLTDAFITAAQQKTNTTRQVFVSNEVDFFQDFEATHGSELPSSGASFGNEWELYVATMTEVSAGLKRALSKLRAAEAMASLVALRTPSFLTGRQAARDKAMLNFGLYFEHNWVANGVVPRTDRADWQRRIANEIHSYVDPLYTDAVTALGAQIQRTGTIPRIFVFNPLGWARGDVAESAYAGPTPVHVVDVTTGQEVPSQIVSVSGQQRLRIFAPNVPSAGYKVFEVRTGAGQTWSQAATVTGGVVENAFYRITFSGRGAITSWIDKTRGNRELVLARNGYALNDLGAGSGTVQVENAGPVSVTLVTTSGTPVAHTTRLTLLRDSRRIAIDNRITQNFTPTQIWQFSFDLPSPVIRHEEVGAVLTAKLTSQGGNYATRNARYDWLTLNHFADVTAADGVGVTLSNADLYFMQLGNSSVTTLDGTTPLIKVLAGKAAERATDGSWLGIDDQGGDTSFTQRFALQSHDTYDGTAAMRFALEHQNPFVVGSVTGGAGYPETNYSFLSVSDPNALLWALKPADDGIERGIVVRMWNMAAAPVTPVVRLVGTGVASASRTTHIETEEEVAPVQNGALVASLAGYQMRTYLLKPSTSSPAPPIMKGVTP
jgi:alpha-mannosidase